MKRDEQEDNQAEGGVEATVAAAMLLVVLLSLMVILVKTRTLPMTLVMVLALRQVHVFGRCAHKESANKFKQQLTKRTNGIPKHQVLAVVVIWESPDFWVQVSEVLKTEFPSSCARAPDSMLAFFQTCVLAG